MNIAILTPGGVDRSGTERVIPCFLWLIERLARSGDNVHIFAFRQEQHPAKWPLLGATVHNGGGTRLVFQQLMAQHRQTPFDVLHAMWASPAGVVAGIGGRLLRVPVLLHLLGGDLCRMPEIGYGGRLTVRGRATAWLALRSADVVAVPSLEMAAQVKGAGVAAARVPFGVALDRWPVVQPRRRAAGSPAKLLHVASLNRIKDQGTLIKAMALLRDAKTDFRLDIIGEDTTGGAVQRMCEALGLIDHVRFHGFLPHRAMRPFFLSADLHIVSSRSEGAPVTVLEAAVAGVPSVGTRVGHLADWAPKAARVVEPGNAAALSQTIAGVLSDEDERLRLATAAQALAIAEDADATTERVRQIYAELRAIQKRHV